MRIWLIFILPLAAGFIIHPLLYLPVLMGLIWSFGKDVSAVMGRLLLSTTLLCTALGSLPASLMLLALNERGEKDFDFNQLGQLATGEQVFLVAGYLLLTLLVVYWLYEMVRLFWQFRKGGTYTPYVVRLFGAINSRAD